MKPRIRLAERQRIRPRMDLTALVDCVFLLLIFFLLSSSFTRQKQLGLDLEPMSGGEETAPDPSALVWVIEKDGTLFLNEEPIAEENVRPRLAEAAERNTGTPMVITADRDAPAGRVLHLLDEARAAGLSSIELTGRTGQDAAP